MNRETDLLGRWRAERPMYDAWGTYVSEKISALVGQRIYPISLELFFRIPVKARTKADASLIAKAFHRGKSYKNPYEDIEDKVGLRVVVLFSEEIRVVEQIIQSCNDWTFSKARDFEEERRSRPFEFDYQSLHYIVKSKSEICRNGVQIFPNIPCEIQIRTILQHAYSELTHDTIYKPSVQAEPSVKRAAAKSMALIEATDDYFTQVREKLELAQAPGRKIAESVEKKYREFVGLAPDSSALNSMLIDHFRQWVTGGFEDELSKFLQEKRFLSDRIRERVESALLFRQPAVLLIYWVVRNSPNEARLDSPLTDSELAPFYGDLGLPSP